MVALTYTEIKQMVEDACGDTVSDNAKAAIAQGFHNTAMMWGLTTQQCGDLIRVARGAYWAAQQECGK